MLTTKPVEEATDCRVGGDFITLNRSAVVQLLFLGLSEEVRESAAAALEHLATADPRQLECSDAVLESLPRWERTAALLAATMVSTSPWPAGSWYARPAVCREAAQPQSDEPRLFRYTTSPVRDYTRSVKGIDEMAFRRLHFRLGSLLSSEIEDDASSSWLNLTEVTRSNGKHWLLDGEGFGIGFTIPYRVFRGISAWKGLRLLSPEGRVVGEFKPAPRRRSPLTGWGIDPGLLMRIESGALMGYLMERRYEIEVIRPDRNHQCIVTVEIGESLADPPLVMMSLREQREESAIAWLGGQNRLRFPLLGGATLESLDAIARRMGVWHGHSLRGSFAYHPLRHRSSVEVA